MAVTILKLKLMPISPEVDLKKIQTEVEERLKKFSARLHSAEQESIAFGLVALVVTIAWPESHSPDEAVEELLHIKEISSIDVIDYRRAFG